MCTYTFRYVHTYMLMVQGLPSIYTLDPKVCMLEQLPIPAAGMPVLNSFFQQLTAQSTCRTAQLRHEGL